MEKYFLGSNTGAGFVSLFGQLEKPGAGGRYFVVKGGPGSGKSTLMKRVAGALEAAGQRIVRVPCASDPESLDAFLAPEIGLAMVDGTPPHAVEPRFPGAYETLIDTGAAWDEGLLREKRPEILALSRDVSRAHARATAALAGAAALRESIRAGAAPDRGRLRALALELAASWPHQAGEAARAERLLSAVSLGGVVFFPETLRALAETVYVLDDPYGQAADTLLGLLEAEARQRGLSVITCDCGLIHPGKREHLILPEVGVAFTTANRYHRAPGTALPLDVGPAPEDAERQDALAAGLVQQAARCVARAKALHDALEAHYRAALDTAALDALYESVMAKI